MGAVGMYAAWANSDLEKFALDMFTVSDNLVSGGYNISIENFGQAYYEFQAAAVFLDYAVLHLYNGSSFADALYSALNWIDTNWPEGNGGEVTMDSIIYAMLRANPDEVDYFVGLVDAFRISIWDKPFNQEFYRALAEGFKTWE